MCLVICVLNFYLPCWTTFSSFMPYYPVFLTNKDNCLNAVIIIFSLVSRKCVSGRHADLRMRMLSHQALCEELCSWWSWQNKDSALTTRRRILPDNWDVFYCVEYCDFSVNSFSLIWCDCCCCLSCSFSPTCVPTARGDDFVCDACLPGYVGDKCDRSVVCVDCLIVSAIR